MTPINELTDESDAGRYAVMTTSGSVYDVVIDPDRPPRIVRRTRANTLQRDGDATPGVAGLRFSVGERGTIVWRRDKHERDDPGAAAYAGTWRSTTAVTAIYAAVTDDDVAELTAAEPLR